MWGFGGGVVEFARRKTMKNHLISCKRNEN
jgi:hypothetical protein